MSLSEKVNKKDNIDNKDNKDEGSKENGENKKLEGLICEIGYVYLDDIIIFSEDIESQEERVKSVLDRLKKNGLQIKIK